MAIRPTAEVAGSRDADDAAASVHWLTTATPPRPAPARRRRVWIVLGAGFVLLWFAAALVALL